MKNLNSRKQIRLQNYNYNTAGAYFITICTNNKLNLFWNNELNPETFYWVSVGANCVRPQNLPLSNIGKFVLKELEKWSNTYHAIYLQSYVVMPNHVHAIVVIAENETGESQPTLSRMVKQFKGSVTKQVGTAIWQKSFMEHIIRNTDDFNTKTNYIYENPLRWHYDELFNK